MDVETLLALNLGAVCFIAWYVGMIYTQISEAIARGIRLEQKIIIEKKDFDGQE